MHSILLSSTTPSIARSRRPNDAALHSCFTLPKTNSRKPCFSQCHLHTGGPCAATSLRVSPRLLRGSRPLPLRRRSTASIAFRNSLDLETFRGAEARQRIMAARGGLYYRLMKFPFWAAMIACLALGLVGFRRGSRPSERLLSLSAALVFVALAMLVLNCALTEYLPRYTLPLWNLVFLAVLLQVRGAINGTTRWLRFSRA